MAAPMPSNVRFVCTPTWLLDAGVSTRAIALYGILMSYADGRNQCWPSRKTLARRMRCSTDTVDRALAELRDAGALTIPQRVALDGGSMTSLYQLIVEPPDLSASQPMGTDAAPHWDSVRPRWGSSAAPPLVADAAPHLGAGAAQNYNHVELEPSELKRDVSEERSADLSSSEIRSRTRRPSKAEGSSSDRREPDPDDRAIAERLDELIHANNPRARPTSAAQLRQWVDVVRLMRERDGRTRDEIRAVLEWSQRDQFWRANILSMGKLREKFDQLALRMQSPPASSGRAAPVGKTAADYRRELEELRARGTVIDVNGRVS